MEELERRALALWQAAKAQGLDPYPVLFELVPANVLYEFGAYGLPGRFGHWSRGKAYHRLKLQYDLGLHRLYEMVINEDPAQAFLLDKNSLLENTFVIAHVLGHSDFFRNNAHLRAAGGLVPHLVSARAERVRRYEEEHGVEAVETTLDRLLAVEWHVAPTVGGRREPEDLLGYLAEHAPLEDWQRDLAQMVREEALYFARQVRTKIANEGWAAFWHLRLLRGCGLADAEYVDFARLHAAVVGGDGLGLNPYRLGLALFERIAERRGLEEAFLARETCDDMALVRNYLDDELLAELGLVVYQRHEHGYQVRATEPREVRAALLCSLENGGHPRIVVAEEQENHGELALRHVYDGRPLDLRYAEETLGHLARLWGAPVTLATVARDRRLILSHDGTRACRQEL
jgi:stage V sporulation protein R